jgi:hypothetical protein
MYVSVGNSAEIYTSDDCGCLKHSRRIGLLFSHFSCVID